MIGKKREKLLRLTHEKKGMTKVGLGDRRGEKGLGEDGAPSQKLHKQEGGDSEAPESKGGGEKTLIRRWANLKKST